jgi:nitrogen fixation/metabolism regulation signal transduction histidine kinase
VVKSKLPAPIAAYEDVRKSERHLAQLTLVRAFQILHAGHDRRVAVTGKFHVHVLNEFFRPFYRVTDARSRDSGGVGLGLAIADRVVRLHGGSIRAVNELDGGLRIEMTFPRAFRIAE